MASKWMEPTPAINPLQGLKIHLGTDRQPLIYGVASLGRESTYELGLWVSPLRRGSSVGLPAAQTRLKILAYCPFLDGS